jgi:hypothetical protein
MRLVLADQGDQAVGIAVRRQDVRGQYADPVARRGGDRVLHFVRPGPGIRNDPPGLVDQAGGGDEHQGLRFALADVEQKSLGRQHAQRDDGDLQAREVQVAHPPFGVARQRQQGGDHNQHDQACDDDERHGKKSCGLFNIS